MEKHLPLVSICCITYNHAPFIRQSIEGMLMQQGVDYEILIHDDCSTDGTTEIVKEYAAKYPEIIFPLYEEVNQYQNGKAGEIDFFNYKRARGKYIAYCEGDDYWTDPLKLQKQVVFMERHPEYSVCFHTFRNYDVNTDKYFETAPTKLLYERNAIDGIDIDFETYFNDWYTQPMTMLYRMSSFNFNWQRQYKYYRDLHEVYHLLKSGKCRLMNFDGGIRNIHEGGVASMISLSSSIDVGVKLSKELYQHNKSEETRKYYCDNLQWKIYNTPQKNRFIDSLTLFLLNFDFIQLIRNLKR